MSGYICGEVILGNKEFYDFKKTFNTEVINQYKLDKFDYSSLTNAQFGCGLIYVNEEDKFEKLPFHEKRAGLYITADVILDNRDDLIQELSLSNRETVITDGRIVLEAYKRWRYDTPKHLLGDFAFAIWDMEKQELFLTRDHTGSRSLYYAKEDDSIRFSTTLNPLLGNDSDKQQQWCDEWLTMYFALPNGMVDYNCNLTMYKNVLQCPIAHSLVITKSEVRSIKFWDPLQLINKKSTKFSKNELINLFNNIFNEAVKCCIRSSGNIGVFLSGGLDSSSVTAIASNLLKSSNKDLYSFTSIPLFEVNGYNKKYYKINEKEDVEAFGGYFPNIHQNYLDCIDQNILSSADELIKIIEMPFQAIDNLTWINEGYKKAEKFGCKILLTGQFGNFTISRGDFITHIQTLKNHGRYFEILNEVEATAKLRHISRRLILKKIFITNVPEALKKVRRKLLGTKKPLFNPYIECLKEDLLNKYEIIEKLKKEKLYESNVQTRDFYEEGAGVLKEIEMTNVSVYDTKFSLNYGLITRDPTKDVRVIEFFLKAPFELFVGQGIQRKFIRDAMEKILPDEIRLNYEKRGLQGVDWGERISHNRIEFFRQLELLHNKHAILQYLKEDKVNEILGYGSELFEPSHADDLRQVIYWIIVNKTLTE